MGSFLQTQQSLAHSDYLDCERKKVLELLSQENLNFEEEIKLLKQLSENTDGRHYNSWLLK